MVFFVAKPALWNQTYARMCWILQHQPTYLTQLSQYIHGNEARIFHPRNRHIHVKQKKPSNISATWRQKSSWTPLMHCLEMWKANVKYTYSAPYRQVWLPRRRKMQARVPSDYLGDSWWFSMFPVKKHNKNVAGRVLRCLISFLSITLFEALRSVGWISDSSHAGFSVQLCKISEWQAKGILWLQILIHLEKPLHTWLEVPQELH